MKARLPKLGVLSMFGRRMRALWEAKEGEELTEWEFVDEMLVGGLVEIGVCHGCGGYRKVLNGFLCSECNRRSVRPEGLID